MFFDHLEEFFRGVVGFNIGGLGAELDRFFDYRIVRKIGENNYGSIGFFGGGFFEFNQNAMAVEFWKHNV